jgi:hypothetical protein
MKYDIQYSVMHGGFVAAPQDAADGGRLTVRARLIGAGGNPAAVDRLMESGLLHERWPRDPELRSFLRPVIRQTSEQIRAALYAQRMEECACACVAARLDLLAAGKSTGQVERLGARVRGARGTPGQATVVRHLNAPTELRVPSAVVAQAEASKRQFLEAWDTGAEARWVGNPATSNKVEIRYGR